MWIKEITAVLVMLSLLSLNPAVVADRGSDNSTVSITVISGCSMNIKSFDVPKDGEIGRNSTGSFEARIVNNGTFKNTVANASLNISYMANDSLEESSNLSTNSTNSSDNDSVKKYLNLGLQQDLNDGYQSKRDYDNFTERVGTSSGNKSVNYIKYFTAVPEYPFTSYNATLNVDYYCKVFEPASNDTTRIIDEENGEDITFINETRSFNIVNATGETRPVPEPVPDPVPDPEPRIELEPVNRTYYTGRGQSKLIPITVDNVGEKDLSDLTIIPQDDVLDSNWESQSASVTSIESGEKLNRSVSVTPPEDAEPGVYTIPVTAVNSNDTELDTDYFYLEVKKTEFQPSFEIVETPRSVRLKQSEDQELPVLIQNTGKAEIKDLEAVIQNSEECVEIDSPIVQSLKPNATTALNLRLNALNKTQTCSSTLTVSGSDGGFASTNLDIEISEAENILPDDQSPPLIAIVWTLVLAIYAVLRKRTGKDNLAVNAPLILLIIGEAVLLIYLAVGYYGVLQVPFLPF